MSFFSPLLSFSILQLHAFSYLSFVIKQNLNKLHIVLSVTIETKCSIRAAKPALPRVLNENEKEEYESEIKHLVCDKVYCELCYILKKESVK